MKLAYIFPLYAQAWCLLTIFGIALLSACSSDAIPKPKAYPRLMLPQKAYKSYAPEDCPYSFEHPVYATPNSDTVFFKQKAQDPCWLDLKFPGLNAQMHFSYKEMNQKGNDLATLVRDAYKMNLKHVRKADYIEDSAFVTKQGVYGIYYLVGGDAASSTQIVLTDSTKHFIWASLYFKETPNEDSIGPVVDFVRKDIDHLIETFRWK